MIGRLRGLVARARRRPRLVALTLILLALVGLFAYRGGNHFWRHHQRQAAQQALDRRDFSEARARLQRCLQRWPDDAEFRLLAARAARRAGDYEEAAEHLDRCDQFVGDPDAVTLERALLAAQTDDPVRVEGYLLSRLKGQPSEAGLIYEGLAHGYLRTHRLAEALDCLERWLEHQPDDVQALVWRGQVLEQWNDLEEATTSYRRAVTLDPGHEKARRRLGLTLVRCDRAREGLEHLELLRQQSADAEVLLGLARGRRTLGQVDEARRLLDEVLAAQPQNAEALSELGKLDLQTGRAGAAEGWLRRSLAMAPYDRETNYTLYLCLLQQGREDEAARALEAVERIRADLQRVSELRRKVAASPRDASLRCEIGLIFLRNGQTREGVRWLQSAVQIEPSHAEARQALARVQVSERQATDR